MVLLVSDFIFEPTPLDDELFINDVPLSILQDLIDDQFNDPIEYRRRDYVKSFMTKYDFSVENSLEDDLVMVETYRNNFVSYMLSMFEKHLEIGFPNFDDNDIDEQHDIIHMVYRFFIKNIKKNFVNCIYNYIYENKNELLDVIPDKKDVASINFKIEIDDEYDIKVLSNLSFITNKAIEYLETLNDINKFLDMCERDEPILEVDYFRELVDEMKVTGNFIPSYISMIESSGFLESGAQSKIRNLILKKYPHRHGETKSEEIEDTSEPNENINTDTSESEDE
jgi:hypothetical protein